jgi:hypothetical protein
VKEGEERRNAEREEILRLHDFIKFVINIIRWKNVVEITLFYLCEKNVYADSTDSSLNDSIYSPKSRILPDS